MDENFFLDKNDHTNAIPPVWWLNHMEFCELFFMCHLNEIVHEIYNMDENEFHENKSQCQWYWKQFHPCISIYLCEPISYVLPSIDLHPTYKLAFQELLPSIPSSHICLGHTLLLSGKMAQELNYVKLEYCFTIAHELTIKCKHKCQAC